MITAPEIMIVYTDPESVGMRVTEEYRETHLVPNIELKLHPNAESLAELAEQLHRIADDLPRLYEEFKRRQNARIQTMHVALRDLQAQPAFAALPMQDARQVIDALLEDVNDPIPF